MFPACPLSRTLGDVLAHQIGVTSEPEVVIVPIESGDSFTVANEHFWNLLKPEDLSGLMGLTLSSSDLSKRLL